MNSSLIKQVQNDYQGLKETYWIVGISFGILASLVLVMLRRMRSIASVFLEFAQVLMLITFTGFNMPTMAMQTVYSLQFSMFKILDVTYLSNSPSFLGFYFAFIPNNLFLLLIAFFLLSMMFFFSFCSCYSIKNFLARLYYRLTILAFLPIISAAFLSVLNRDQISAGDIYAGFGIFVVYSIIMVINIFRFMAKAKYGDEMDDEDSINILEYKNGLTEKRKMAVWYNLAVMPIFKAIICLWTIFNPNYLNAQAFVVPIVFFVILFVVCAFIRPFDKLIHNIYLLVTICTYAIVMFLAIGSLTIDILAKNAGYGIVALIILHLILTLVICIFVPAELHSKSAVVPLPTGDNILTTEPNLNLKQAPIRVIAGKPQAGFPPVPLQTQNNGVGFQNGQRIPGRVPGRAPTNIAAPRAPLQQPPARGGPANRFGTTLQPPGQIRSNNRMNSAIPNNSALRGPIAAPGSSSYRNLLQPPRLT